LSGGEQMAKSNKQKGQPQKSGAKLVGSPKRFLRMMGSAAPGNCGYVRHGAQSPANIKKMVLAAIGAPANTPDGASIASLMNANTGNPIWEAAIQCMHYGQFNTDQFSPMPIYFNDNGATVAGFVQSVQCCYAHPQPN
jgi:hypothetical protein